jgi:hypothetical protein
MEIREQVMLNHYHIFEEIIKAAKHELALLALPVDIEDKLDNKLDEIRKEVIEACEETVDEVTRGVIEACEGLRREKRK